MISEKTENKSSRNYGRKVKRVRQLFDIKQEVLAEQLGLSQSQYSRMEKNNEIDDLLLEQIAKLLGVSTEFIKNFDVETLSKYFIHNGEYKSEVASGFSNSGPVENNEFIFNDSERLEKKYDKIIEEYKEIIAQKDSIIKDLQAIIDSLKK